MLFYDAQNGEFLNIEEYANDSVSYFEVLKVDKLLLRKDIIKRISRTIPGRLLTKYQRNTTKR